MQLRRGLRGTIPGLVVLSVLASLVLVARPAHAQDELGQRWDQVQEGWPARWVRRGTSNTFDYTSAPGPRGIVITGVVTVNFAGNQVTATRRSSSDGVNCDYTGTLAADGAHVAGTFSCGAAGGGSWSAVIVGAGPSLGRSWRQQQEGWASQWVRRGMTNTFNYTSAPGPRGIVITGIVTVTIRGNQVTAARRSSSDGVDCDYTGTLAADKVHVAGTFSCGAAGGGSWSAEIQP